MAEKPVKKAPIKVEVDADKSYQILSKLGAKAMSATDEEAVLMGKAGKDPKQQFVFIPVDEDYYKIVSKETGRVLDVILAGTENGAQVHQWDYTGADNQLWSVEKAGRYYVKIRSKASGKVLDIVGMSPEDGARIQIWDDANGENQLWKLKEEKPPAPKKTAAKKSGEEKPKKPAKPRASKAKKAEEPEA